MYNDVQSDDNQHKEKEVSLQKYGKYYKNQECQDEKQRKKEET